MTMTGMCFMDIIATMNFRSVPFVLSNLVFLRVTIARRMTVLGVVVFNFRAEK